MNDSNFDLPLPLNPNPNIHRRGMMVALSAPSGGGKTTIARAILERDPYLSLSISYTTRPQRPGEVHGQHYYFVSPEEFQRKVDENYFLEYAKVFDHFYGTPYAPVQKVLEEGKDVLFDIDWQGTQQLTKRAQYDIVSIFVLPPSAQELDKRLRSRGRDPEEEIIKRMSKASDEMSHWDEYHYIIVNNKLDESIQKVEAIILTERLIKRRQLGLRDFVEQMQEKLGCNDNAA